MTAVVVLQAVALGVLALIVFGLLRTHAEILRALDRAGFSLDPAATSSASGDAAASRGGESGGVARDVVGVLAGGGPAKVAVTGVPRLTLLAFLSSGCRTCQRFWQAFAEAGLEFPGEATRLVIVGQDPPYDSASAFAALVPPGVKAVLSNAAWEDYQVPGSPYFVLVDGLSERVIGAGTALSWPQLRDLLRRALEDGGWGDEQPAVPRSRRNSMRHREQRMEQALLSAGIGPGHRSLYQHYGHLEASASHPRESERESAADSSDEGASATR